jgi:hypothetical protein
VMLNAPKPGLYAITVSDAGAGTATNGRQASP